MFLMTREVKVRIVASGLEQYELEFYEMSKSGMKLVKLGPLLF